MSRKIKRNKYCDVILEPFRVLARLCFLCCDVCWLARGHFVIVHDCLPPRTASHPRPLPLLSYVVPSHAPPPPLFFSTPRVTTSLNHCSSTPLLPLPFHLITFFFKSHAVPAAPIADALVSSTGDSRPLRVRRIVGRTDQTKVGRTKWRTHSESVGG